MRCSYIRLLVNDYEACFHFYSDVLGLPVLWGDEKSRYAEFDVRSGTRLALNQREVMAEALETDTADPELPHQDRLAVIFEVDDVDEEAARLTAGGARQVMEPRDWTAWGIRAAHFRDPDGYLLEINRPLIPMVELDEPVRDMESSEG
ncbi:MULTISPECIES: VOC family protein [Nocardiopsis]|jgi:catechol 2,3-dioxygenase-like lactoylglutathione lyase family enzyme|uniref:VOC family protein n=2 Tax=Nocardiopsis alba TaxID=53437 RepID=A0A7K2IRU8_9ACTN|nr:MULTISPECIES: VOC family protein [Nocardiopsis]AFR05728.1 glyoxalase/Bleomycin resistance /Dioxygenase superfamily protein [Nocardiopsis alba ATCC BAA-2165]MEC3895332.1 VOC family protein [Nocardiopsis sp. LDBS1602]MYR32700.1 VOC family protein [Nocardiopsis alba]